MLEGAVATDTTVRWTPVTGAEGYRIRWRRADRQTWESSRDMPADATQAKLSGLIVDDNFIGVAALGKGGAESLVTFGGLPPR